MMHLGSFPILFDIFYSIGRLSWRDMFTIDMGMASPLLSALVGVVRFVDFASLAKLRSDYYMYKSW